MLRRIVATSRASGLTMATWLRFASTGNVRAFGRVMHVDSDTKMLTLKPAADVTLSVAEGACFKVGDFVSFAAHDVVSARVPEISLGPLDAIRTVAISRNSDGSVKQLLDRKARPLQFQADQVVEVPPDAVTVDAVVTRSKDNDGNRVDNIALILVGDKAPIVTRIEFAAATRKWTCALGVLKDQRLVAVEGRIAKYGTASVVSAAVCYDTTSKALVIANFVTANGNPVAMCGLPFAMKIAAVRPDVDGKKFILTLKSEAEGGNTAAAIEQVAPAKHAPYIVGEDVVIAPVRAWDDATAPVVNAVLRAVPETKSEPEVGEVQQGTPATLKATRDGAIVAILPRKVPLRAGTIVRFERRGDATAPYAWAVREEQHGTAAAGTDRKETISSEVEFGVVVQNPAGGDPVIKAANGGQLVRMAPRRNPIAVGTNVQFQRQTSSSGAVTARELRIVTRTHPQRNQRIVDDGSRRTTVAAERSVPGEITSIVDRDLTGTVSSVSGDWAEVTSDSLGETLEAYLEASDAALRRSITKATPVKFDVAIRAPGDRLFAVNLQLLVEKANATLTLTAWHGSFGSAVSPDLPDRSIHVPARLVAPDQRRAGATLTLTVVMGHNRQLTCVDNA